MSVRFGIGRQMKLEMAHFESRKFSRHKKKLETPVALSYRLGVRVITRPSELQPSPNRVCLAIGFFDGVHLGHQQIIRQTVADAALHEAMAVVVTFDRHPNTVVAPERVPPLIYSLPQKLRAIESIWFRISCTL